MNDYRRSEKEIGVPMVRTIVEREGSQPLSSGAGGENKILNQVDVTFLNFQDEFVVRD